MRELLIATTNKGKLREIQELLKGLDLKITSLADYPGLPNVIEDGKTFRSNAVKKALTIAGHTRKLTMGEDSGLEVKALGNQPGIYSARFASTRKKEGVNAQDKKNNAKLLRLLHGKPAGKREAQYRSVVAIADGKKVVGVVSGSCRGIIAKRSRGKNGFGYDSLFLIPKYNKTFGELDPGIKAKISHRARALKKTEKMLEKYFGAIESGCLPCSTRKS